MKALFCGYRSWALTAYAELSVTHDVDIATNVAEMERALEIGTYDVVVLAGWSWRVPDSVLSAHYVVGMHPSDLPEFAGGSPIQNQVLAGITKTRASLFRVTPHMDAGPIIAKCDIDLSGHMDEIFCELARVTTKLVGDFLDAWPNVSETQQTGVSTVRRLKPTQSELSRNDLATMTCAKLYDAIRCREDPYPNVFVKDETGTLVFKRVEFIPSEDRTHS